MQNKKSKSIKVLETAGKAMLTVVVGGAGLLADMASNSLAAYNFKASSKAYRTVENRCKEFVHDTWIFDSDVFAGTHRNNIKNLDKAVKKAVNTVEKDRRRQADTIRGCDV